MVLKTEEFEINGTKFKIKQLSAAKGFDLMDIKDRREAVKKMAEVSVIEPKVTDKFWDEISLETYLELVKKINKLNGMEREDFQSVPEG